MAVTPNYGWPIPVATDYVKDGYDAIADLGNAIDSTVAGLGSGLVKLNTTAFTTSSGVIVDNIFSSTYDNYQININFTAVSATNPSILWYGRSGSPATDTTTSYQHQQIYGTGSSVGAATSTNSLIGDVSNNYPDYAGLTATFFAPNLAKRTVVISQTHNWTNAGATVLRQIGVVQNSTTQFTGIKILPDSGTISGTLFIYGYQK